MQLGDKSHYSSNIGTVLVQVTTGGGGAHLEEQLMCLDVPSLSAHSFVHLEKLLGAAQPLEGLVTTELLSTGKEELGCAKNVHNVRFEDVPACCSWWWLEQAKSQTLI